MFSNFRNPLARLENHFPILGSFWGRPENCRLTLANVGGGWGLGKMIVIREIKLFRYGSKPVANKLPLKTFWGKSFTALILSLALNALDCPGQEPLPAWRTNLQEYLTNRPWVSEIEYDWSRNHDSVGGKRLEGKETFQASLQPGGYFLHSTTNFPVSRNLTIGESTNDYWQITISGVAFAPKSPEKGGSVSNSIPKICVWQKQNLLDVLNLGIAGLDTATIEWSSPTNFTAYSMSDGVRTGGRIQGQIEESDQGLPSLLRYMDTSNTNEERVVLYEYDNPSLPPRETTVQIWEKGKKTIVLKNVIKNIVFGLRPEASQGFLLSAFLPSDFVPARMLIQSNGLRYALQADGSWKMFEPTKEALLDFNGVVEKKHSPWTFFLFTLIGVTIVFILLIRKRRSTD